MSFPTACRRQSLNADFIFGVSSRKKGPCMLSSGKRVCGDSLSYCSCSSFPCRCPTGVPLVSRWSPAGVPLVSRSCPVGVPLVSRLPPNLLISQRLVLWVSVFLEQGRWTSSKSSKLVGTLSGQWRVIGNPCIAHSKKEKHSCRQAVVSIREFMKPIVFCTRQGNH